MTSSSLAHRPAAVRTGLPAPTGVHPVGTHSLRLRSGELPVRLWYPADRTSVAPPAPYLPAGAAARLVQDLPDDLLTFPTHSGQDAPAADGPRRPVLLFSPGLGAATAFHTGLLEELASQGYVVAGIDHPADTTTLDHDQLLATRVADVRSVLDHLHTIAGTHPTAGPTARLAAGPSANLAAAPIAGSPLPVGLARILDVTRVGVFGHSLGSRTAVRVIEHDRRVAAAAALDGNPLGPATIDRPFLLLGNETHADDPDWADFHDRLLGPRLHLSVTGARHHDLSDVAVLKHALDLSGIYAVGPIDGTRALAVQRAYVTAWFDRHLRRRWRPLLRGRSERFPEVSFA